MNRKIWSFFSHFLLFNTVWLRLRRVQLKWIEENFLILLFLLQPTISVRYNYIDWWNSWMESYFRSRKINAEVFLWTFVFNLARFIVREEKRFPFRLEISGNFLINDFIWKDGRLEHLIKGIILVGFSRGSWWDGSFDFSCFL